MNQHIGVAFLLFGIYFVYRNETNFALTAGAGECRGPADNDTDAERETKKTLRRLY